MEIIKAIDDLIGNCKDCKFWKEGMTLTILNELKKLYPSIFPATGWASSGRIGGCRKR
jgi:hypothetical protein